LLVMVSQPVVAADEKAGAVLRKPEPRDSVVVTLPGPPPGAPAYTTLPATVIYRTPPKVDSERPVLRRPVREISESFEQDSSRFLNQQIGTWVQMDAQALLGEPIRQRPALGEGDVANGTILAFLDPSGRYKEFELDFDGETGKLRTLFVYPYSLTWQDCLRDFGTNVQPSEANKGRIFYSYADRRLDVLVDPDGKVVSLGMY
jgi:hypothetical protein